MPPHRYFLELAGAARVEIPASEGIRLKRRIELGWVDIAPLQLIVEPV